MISVTRIITIAALFFGTVSAFGGSGNASLQRGVSAGSTTALNGATRVTIIVGDNEPIENALKRFKREANKSGHLRELRHRRHFENGQEKKKRKIREAGMRRRFERINRQRNAARMNRT